MKSVKNIITVLGFTFWTEHFVSENILVEEKLPINIISIDYI
jgi:hypothetical protein